MAIAIREIAAKTTFRNVTQGYVEHGREGSMVNCSGCGERFVLYFGPRMDLAEATRWLEEESRRRCPHHVNCIAVNEPAPAGDGRALLDLAREAEAEELQAENTQGQQREMLLVSAARKRTTIRDVQAGEPG